MSRAIRWENRLLQILILVSFLNGAKAQVPFEFTSQERTQFLDAKGKYAAKALPDLNRTASAFAWLDSRAVLFSVRELTGRWKAAQHELSRVVVLDTETMEVHDSGYRGELMCFTPRRMVVVQPAEGTTSLGFRENDLYLAGPWGGKLEQVRKEQGHFLAQWSCEFQPIVTQLSSSSDVQELRLLPGHGRLRFPAGNDLAARPGAEAVTSWLDDEGRVLGRWGISDSGVPISELVVYVRWVEAYFFASYRGGVLYRPPAEIEPVPLPALLHYWTRNYVGSATPQLVRGGVVWGFRGLSGYWRKQGLYVATEQGLIRVDDAEPTAMPNAVSPDGCRLFYRRKAGNPLDGESAAADAVMNFCEERNI